MASHIYHGPWVNWGQGNIVTGAVLTLSERNGGLLTTFIATFVTLVGAQLWKILAFSIHQIRSTTKPEDGLFHQQQAIWRNTAAPGTAAWTFMQQLWYWRNRAQFSFVRTFSWALFAALYLIVFALAAVFSSEISKAPGSQRLIIGENCGYWFLDQTASAEQTRDASTRKMTNQSLVTATYSRACYGGSYSALQCSRYPVSSLLWDAQQNATCPFQNNMCIYGNTAAYSMTSRLIDSQADLGINTPKNQRVQMQKRTTCAPVTGRSPYRKFTDEPVLYDNGTTAFTNQWQEALYGPTYLNGKILLNYTERVNINGFYDAVGYQLSTSIGFSNDTTSNGWRPIPSLARTDADTTMLFLRGNSVRFAKPVDDPFFYAHETVTNATYVVSDFWITALGCVEQYRYCNPNNNVCTEWLGAVQGQFDLARNSSDKLGLDLLQQNVAARLSYTSLYTSTFYQTFSRGANALRAQETLTQLDQAPLGPLQWQVEVGAWFDSSLASLQKVVLDYAVADAADSIPVGAKVSFLDLKENQATSWAAQYMCWNQLINETANTMSFSILGMAILFAVGGFIIFTSFILERLIAWLQHLFKFNLHGSRAWMLDDKLRMQRDLFEKSGMARWKEDDDDAVPVTVGKEKFSRFPRDQLFSPNKPDTPWGGDGYMDQKTEYDGHTGKVMQVNVQEGRSL